MPDAGVLATILLIAGLFLLVLEFFIPSFGLIGIIAGLCLLVSFWSAFQAWGGGRNPGFFWTYVIFLMCGVPGTISLGFYLLQYSPIGKSVVLQPPKHTTHVSPLQPLVGKRGVTQTLLTPGGMVLVDNNRYHAESVGMLIDPQTPVIVVDVRQNSLVVRPATDESPAPPAPGVTPAVTTAVKPPVTTAASSTPQPPAARPTVQDRQGREAKAEPSSELAGSEMSGAVPPKTRGAGIPPTRSADPQVVTGPDHTSSERDKRATSGSGENPDKLDFDIPEDYTP